MPSRSIGCPAERAGKLFPELRLVFAILGRAAQVATGRFLRREDQERFVGETRERLRQGLHAGEVPRQGPPEPSQGGKTALDAPVHALSPFRMRNARCARSRADEQKVALAGESA